jgi:signal transduction histidine kinase/ActR/RegA family two-component response regulator
MQSASSQSHRKAVCDGFAAEDAGTSGTSRRRSQRRLTSTHAANPTNRSSRKGIMAVRSRLARYTVAVLSSACAAGGGAALQSLFGYRFPLITFYPAIMVSAWFGGLWPGIAATLVSSVLVGYLWLAPLRAANVGTVGDSVALLLFVGIGLAISACSESMHRSAAREHAARERAEQREQALQESELRLRTALAGAQAARASAEEANRLKDQFVATVSHELRTPLNALLGWADMLKSNMLEDGRRERAIEAIHANARRQARLVDDLLDIARMMSGKLQLRRAGVNLDDAVRAAVDVVQPAADAKRIELTVAIPGPLPPLHADAMRLQQAVWNLLSNAIKFTPDHGVIHIAVQKVGGNIEIVVTDTGQGIQSELLRSIFDPFRQGDTSTTRATGGLGLGLSIVKYVVEAHGGTVNAESPGEGRGATFKVRLPVLPVPESGIESSSTPVMSLVQGSVAGVKVLIVDDDGDGREVMAAHLEQHGATVLTAAGAREALDMIQRQHVDVLLVDVAMPGTDGYTFIKTLRNSSSSSIAGIPAAAVTALAGDEDRARALRAGFQLHIPKPVDLAALVHAVASLSVSHSIHA